MPVPALQDGFLYTVNPVLAAVLGLNGRKESILYYSSTRTNTEYTSERINRISPSVLRGPRTLILTTSLPLQDNKLRRS